jgi:hypothetical protein
MSALPAHVTDRLPATLLEQLAAIPEEEIWQQKQKSARTRRAYRPEVAHFLRTIGISEAEALRQVDHRAMITSNGRCARARRGTLNDPPAASCTVVAVQAL